jgi:membrane protease YdiL (CAAX protease family)
MSEDGSRNFHPMDEPKDHAVPDAGDAIPDRLPGISSSLGPGHDLIEPSPFEQRVQSVFIGPDGLRPVWRFLLYLLLYYVLKLALRVLISSALADTPRIWLLLLVELGFVVIAFIPALVMARMESRPFGDYGLPLRNAFGRLFWIGAAWGLLSLTALLLGLRAAGGFHIEGFALHGTRMLKFAVFWAAFFLVVAIYEEFFTRGYSQFTLTQAIGFWPSAVLLSVGFGLLHLENPGESSIGILGAIAIGFFFCLTLRRTGNLWFALGFHASWDWAESYLYSVPDSGTVAPGHLLQTSLRGSPWLTGGPVGPEGSVFLFLLLALLWVVFDRLYPEVRYPSATKAKEISDPGL